MNHPDLALAETEPTNQPATGLPWYWFIWTLCRTLAFWIIAAFFWAIELVKGIPSNVTVGSMLQALKQLYVLAKRRRTQLLKAFAVFATVLMAGASLYYQWLSAKLAHLQVIIALEQNCKNPNVAPNNTGFNLAALWEVAQNLQNTCPYDPRLFRDGSNRTPLTLPACKAIAGAGPSVPPLSLVWFRSSFWTLPLLQLLVLFARPLLGMGAEFFAIIQSNQYHFKPSVQAGCLSGVHDEMETSFSRFGGQYL
jgi:hypothetical protein